MFSTLRAPTLFFAVLAAVGVSTFPCRTLADRKIQHGIHFWTYTFDPSRERIDLHLPERVGQPNTFPLVAETVREQGRELRMAMNAGIFEGNFRPTGLHVAAGEKIVDLNLETFRKEREGQLTPNFYLKPNAVFSIDASDRARILESTRYARSGIHPVIATQSGPLLVAGGRIHPILTRDSTSTRYRNGVGVREDGTVVFACSVLEPDLGMSNLYHFAEFFRDVLRCPDALYLDGDISYIYIAEETPPLEKTNLFGGIFTITRPIP